MLFRDTETEREREREVVVDRWKWKWRCEMQAKGVCGEGGETRRAALSS
jgi:hypothetical protein